VVALLLGILSLGAIGIREFRIRATGVRRDAGGTRSEKVMIEENFGEQPKLQNLGHSTVGLEAFRCCEVSGGTRKEKTARLGRWLDAVICCVGEVGPEVLRRRGRPPYFRTVGLRRFQIRQRIIELEERGLVSV
jgi:hypothetical protein